jgi:hypothetical protein
MRFRAELRAAAKAGRPANMRGISLYGLDLSETSLRNANLTGANLRTCKLHWTNFAGADLRNATLPAPSVMLAADWTMVRDEELIRDLMRYDAENHENPEAFVRWANGGECPYSGSMFGRAALFSQDPGAFKAGRAPRAYDLLVRVFKAAGVKWGRL